MTLTDELDLPALSSQACAMWVTVNFMCGQGVDTPRLQRALELEDPRRRHPSSLRRQHC